MYMSPNYSLRACLMTLSRVSNTHLHQEFYEDTGGMLTQKKKIKICLTIWIQSKFVCSTACIHFEESKLDENWKKVLFVWQSISQHLWAKCWTLFLNGLSVKEKKINPTNPKHQQNKTWQNKNHQRKFHLQRIFAVEVLFHSTQIFKSPNYFFDFWSPPPAFTRRASLIDSGIIQFSSFQVNQFSSWHKACRIKRALPGTKAVLPQSHVSLTVLTACNPELCCCALLKPLSQTFLLFITWPSILPRTCARL